MVENATAEAFTPRDALAALAEARGFEMPLRHRTEGLTWMIWGLVAPGIFLTYTVMGRTFESDFPAWGGFLWVPWVAAGVTATIVLWKTAALAHPALDAETRPAWPFWAFWIALTSAAWGVAFLVRDRMNEPTYWLLALGTLWLAMNFFNLEKATPRGRRVGLTISGGLIAVGLALIVVAPGRSDFAYAVSGVTSIVASALVPFLGGLWQALRG